MAALAMDVDKLVTAKTNTVASVTNVTAENNLCAILDMGLNLSMTRIGV